MNALGPVMIALVAAADPSRSTDAQRVPFVQRAQGMVIDDFERLRSSNHDERNEARWAIGLERRRIIHQLHWITRSSLSDATKCETAKLAIVLLGEMRAPEAVPLLVDNLKFTLPLGVGPSRIESFPTMPHVQALIDIGLPSADPLVKKVAQSDDEVIRERAAIVIDQILGTDMAVLFVRDRRDRERDEVKRQRLDRLLEQIDKVERNRKGKINFGPLRPPPEVKAPPKP